MKKKEFQFHIPDLKFSFLFCDNCSISIAKVSISEGTTEVRINLFIFYFIHHLLYHHKCYMTSSKMADSLKVYLQEAVEKIGIPKVISCKCGHRNQAV